MALPAAAESLEPVLTDASGPGFWLATGALRITLSRCDAPVRCSALADAIKRPRSEVRDQLRLLERAGLVQAHEVEGTGARYSLTERGRNSIDSIVGLKPQGMPESGPGSWAAAISATLAKNYGCSVHEVLRTGERGPAALARARLCAALHERGWHPWRISYYYAIPLPWVEAGIDRWRKWWDDPLVARRRTDVTGAIIEPEKPAIVAEQAGVKVPTPARPQVLDAPDVNRHHRRNWTRNGTVAPLERVAADELGKARLARQEALKRESRDRVATARHERACAVCGRPARYATRHCEPVCDHHHVAGGGQ